jgi:hypothetical protein
MRRGTAQLPAICWPQSMAATERRRSLWPSAKYRACMPPFGITGIVGKLADGSRAQSVGFKIRSLKIGSVTVENVSGSIAPSQGTLLLGQSFLERFHSWSIDNTKHELLLVP